MAHFAEINKDGIVQRVIVAEQDFIDSGLVGVGDSQNWVQTSYNTQAGINKTGGIPLRKNYAGIGYTYDKGRDAFIPPQSSADAVLNENTCLWEIPNIKK